MPVAELVPSLEAARAVVVVTPLIGGCAHVLAVVGIANTRVHMPVAELVPSLEAARAIVTPLIGSRRARILAVVGIANTRVHMPVAELVPSLEAACAIVTRLIVGRAQSENIAAQLVPVTVELLSRDADIGPLVPDPGDILANLAALTRDRIGVAAALRGPQVAHVLSERRAGAG